MRVTCASCGAVVSARDVSLERMLAKCARCNAVFDIRAQVGGAAPGTAAAEKPVRPLVPLPRNVRVLADEVAGGLETYRDNAGGRPQVVVERRWFTPTLFFMVFFCLFWDGFLVFWYGMAIHGGAVGMLVFPLLHVGAGVWITYATLAGFVNRTRIAVADGVLSVRHGPLPWRGNREIPTADLAQLYCQEHVGNKGARTYSLNALLNGGEKVGLVRSMPEPDQALYLEHLLEARLGIADVPVVGELT